jgi:capsid assembly protease
MRLIDVLTAPWAIIPEKLLEIRAIYEAHVRGEKIDLKAIEANIGQPLARREQGYEIQHGIAIVPVEGVMAKKMNLFSRISGGASTELIARDIDEAVADPRVHAILLDIDSPGGAVDGTQTLARAIRAADERKPVFAFAEGTVASAAYWIASAAREIQLGSDTTQAGSIGVVATHVDVSRAEDRYGYKTTEITAGKYKRIASQYGALSEEGRSYMQDQVDQIYTAFVNDVAAQRMVSTEAVLEHMADGRVFIGPRAIAAGLADGMTSRRAYIELIASGHAPERRSATISVAVPAGVPVAAADPAEPEAGEPQAQSDPATDRSHTMDKDQLVAEHPAIAEALRAEGASAERARIQGVLANGMPGHEALVEGLAFDGKTTPDAAAAAVLRAERSAREKQRADLAADAGRPLAQQPAPEPAAEQPPAPKAQDPVRIGLRAREIREAALARGESMTATDAARRATEELAA